MEHARRSPLMTLRSFRVYRRPFAKGYIVIHYPDDWSDDGRLPAGLLRSNMSDL